jgi:hypothetical protein
MKNPQITIRIPADFNSRDEWNGRTCVGASPHLIPAEHLKVGTKVIAYEPDCECEGELFLTEKSVWIVVLDESTYAYPTRIEADTRLTREQLQAALAASGFDTISEEKDGLSAYEAVSGSTLRSWEHPEDKRIQGMLVDEYGRQRCRYIKEHPGWDVGMRICIIGPSNKYRQGHPEIRMLLENLAKLSDSYFLFYSDNEYYCMTAHRNSEGLHFHPKLW